MGRNRLSQLKNNIFLCFYLTAILLFRKPDVLLRPQLWAEDGTIFLKQQVEQGFSAIFIPYAGYLNLGSRLIAWLGNSIDFLYIPAFYNFCSLLALLGCALFIVHARLPIPKSCKYLMALALVLVPHGGEVFLNITNLQWILATLLPILLIQQLPQRNLTLYFELALILIIGFTGPFIILLSPLIVYRWFLYKGILANIAVTVVSLPAILVQAYLVLTSPETNQDLPIADLPQWVESLSNFSSGLFLGTQLSQYIPLTFKVLLLLIFFAALIFALYRVNATYRVSFPFCISLLFSAIVIYAASLVKFENMPTVIHAFGGGQRYFYLPYLFVSWLFIIFIYNKSLVRRIGILGATLMLLSSTTAFSIPPMQDFHWSRYARQLNQGQAVKAPINPPGWFAEISPQK